MSQSVLSVSCACLVSFLAVLCLRSITTWRARARGRPLPPGPKRIPFLGNPFSIPRWKPWYGFRDLTARFGEIVYLEAFGQPLIVLGSPRVLFEFLEKRSANTSDRTVSPLLPLVGQDHNFTWMRYGPFWRRHRRAFWQHFHPGVLSKYLPVQRTIARKFLVKLLEKPGEYRNLIRYNFTAVILEVIYGTKIDDDEDKRIAVVDDAFAGLRELTASAQFLLENMPTLGRLPKWVPRTGFLWTVEKSKAPNEYMVQEMFDQTKTSIERGEGSPSVISDLLSRIARMSGPEEASQEERVARGVATVAAQGEQGVFSTTEGLFVALSQHPDVQEKARAELDAIVGPNRLPDWDDRDSLVYISAIIKEALRWHTVLPLGVSHRTLEDDELDGYFIPAGTTVVPNVWDCLHNPEIYPEPWRFSPDRYIRDGKLNPDVPDPASLAFGFGRRICPGRHFAENALFIMVAALLHVFEIGPPLDDDGHPVQIPYEGCHGFVSYPEDCRCTIKPRSAEAVSLILAAEEKTHAHVKA
ncbi:cytochrome P450 [Trametes cingulata]|nr:cytochrome P450 [Trametes cingulata]